ncbi:amino acid ABC transporter substrate-binding protein [Chloroflexota bacterium]
MKKKTLVIIMSCLMTVVMATSLFAAGCGEAEPEKTSIVFGGARPLSGPNAIYEETAFGPLYKMWVDEINAKGGIYIKEYDKRLPIELKIYDDTSDMGTMTRLMEKLILEDEVDFILPPASTAFLFAAAPIANKYGYILMGAEGGGTTIKPMLSSLPYFFGVLNFSDHNQVPVMADILKDAGIEKVAIMFLDDLYGVEYSGVAVTELSKRDIDIVMIKSVPFEIKDVAPILTEAKALGAEAFLSLAYPDQNFLAIGTAAALDINFDAIVCGPGVCFAAFPGIFGPAAEGVMGFGAWNNKSSPAAQEFYDKFVEVNGVEILDWWGHLHYYGGLQFFEQAIEKAGTLDQAVIRDIMATETFDTVLGPTWFDGGLLAIECYAGQVGQWQNGIFEVIDPGSKRTAPPVIPKADWPAAP